MMSHRNIFYKTTLAQVEAIDLRHPKKRRKL